MFTPEQMYHIIDCVEAQAKAAAEKPDPHNLMQLGASIASLRNGVREMYSTQTAAETDGWIEWHGGKRPFESNAQVEIRLRTREEFRAPPVHHYEWRHLDKWSDIIAYRVVS